MAAFHLYLAPGDFWSQSLLQFLSKLGQIAVFVGDSRHDCDILRDGNRLVDWNHIRHVGDWVHSELLECNLNRGRELVHLLLVHLRSRIHHYEKGEEKGNEVCVRHQPTIVAGMGDMFFSAPHFAEAAAAFCANSGLLSPKNPDNLVSSIRGFMPSKIETTPSSVISRSTCSSRMRIRSLPAAGSRKRLAAPTP